MKERIIYISYSEARKLAPLLEYVRDNATDKTTKMSASRILKHLSFVRPDVDYSPLRGYQMILREEDYEFLVDLLGALK